VSTLKVNKLTARDGSVYQNILQVESQTYNTTFSITNPGTSYTQTPLSITINPKGDNSKFLAVADIQGYTTNATNGWNVGIWGRIGMTGVTNAVTNVPGADDSAQYAFTMNAGLTGSAGDSWMGFGHGSTIGNMSWSRTRTVLYSPGLAKGTPFTMTVLIGGWSSTGTFAMGWSSYPNSNKITVFEIAT
jgi:hypothetical protein